MKIQMIVQVLRLTFITTIVGFLLWVGLIMESESHAYVHILLCINQACLINFYLYKKEDNYQVECLLGTALTGSSINFLLTETLPISFGLTIVGFIFILLHRVLHSRYWFLAREVFICMNLVHLKWVVSATPFYEWGLSLLGYLLFLNLLELLFNRGRKEERIPKILIVTSLSFLLLIAVVYGDLTLHEREFQIKWLFILEGSLLFYVAFFNFNNNSPRVLFFWALYSVLNIPIGFLLFSIVDNFLFNTLLYLLIHGLICFFLICKSVEKKTDFSKIGLEYRRDVIGLLLPILVWILIPFAKTSWVGCWMHSFGVQLLILNATCTWFASKDVTR